MIFHYIGLAFRWLLRWLVPPPASYWAKAERNRKCPVCGHRQGRLRCVEVPSQEPQKQQGVRPMMTELQHSCLECGARCYEKPLDPKATTMTVRPAVARDDGERAEDAAQTLKMQN